MYAIYIIGVYEVFRHYWKKQYNNSNKEGVVKKPSLVAVLIQAFGSPFMIAGLLKLIHDSCLFVGPLLLNKLIKYLNDPSIPISTGMTYVVGIFLANFVMSVCLRQYFWWCYRVGMRLRSVVVTAVFSKALVLSISKLLLLLCTYI